MKTIESTLSAVAEAAANPLGDMRVVNEIAPGQFARQGDVYIVRIDAVSQGWQKTLKRQLAPGTTQGSRHTVDASVIVYENPAGLLRRSQTGRGLAFEGPQIHSDDRFTVSHPEHADISLPGGTYQVLFQSDFASQQRARD
jgi:hypothetical protein